MPLPLSASPLVAELGKLRPHIAIYTAEQLAKRPRQEWQVHRRIYSGSLVFVISPPGGYKTTFLLDLGECLARGKAFAGEPVKQGAVLMLMGEGAGGIGGREDGWRKAHGGLPRTDKLFFATFTGSLYNKQDCDDLVAAMRDRQVKTLIVDTLAACSAGADENSSRDMGIVLGHLRHIQQQVNPCTIIIAHHTPRNAPDRERGSTVLRGAADTMIVLKREEHSAFLTVECDKQKDAKEFEPLYFTAEEVVLDELDEYGESLTACVLVPSTAAARPMKPGGLSAWDERILRALETPGSQHKTKQLWQAAGGRGDKPFREFSQALKDLRERQLLVKIGGHSGVWMRSTGPVPPIAGIAQDCFLAQSTQSSPLASPSA